MDSVEHSHSFPGLFAGVLGHDETPVQGTFRRCQDFFDAFIQMRQRAVHEDNAKALLDSIPWANNDWTWEILIAMSECKFRAIPKPGKAEVVFGIVRGFVSSWTCELQMNVLRDCERQHQASKLGRTARWHRLMTTALPADFDRKPVHVSETDAVDVGVRTTPNKFDDVQSHALSSSWSN